MRAVLEVQPTTSFQLASQVERSDSMLSLANKLMGLSHPLQLACHSRELDTTTYDWRTPPRIERRWYAAMADTSLDALRWRVRTLSESLEAVGLRCGPPEFHDEPAGHVARVLQHAVLTGDGQWCSTMVLRRWPRQVAPGWLGHALSLDVPVDTSIHIQPMEPQQVARWLGGRAQMLSADSAGHELGRQDAQRMQRKLVARTDRPVKVAIAFTVKDSDVNKLLSERLPLVQYELGLTLGDAREARFEHDRGRFTTELNGTCSIGDAWHKSECTSVAATWLFQPSTVNHKHGAPLGTTHGMLVKLDPFDESLESFGGLILAKVGAGKSYLLKLISRRLKDVEVLIVEQRSPGEYKGVPGATVVNLADYPVAERASRLRDFINTLWTLAVEDPRPRLLVLDELWTFLRVPEFAAMVEELARIGRHHYLSLWIATQQVEELLSTEQGLSVLNNAAIRIYLRQNGPDVQLLADKLKLSYNARQFLRSAGRGQALLDVGGMLIPLDIQADPDEHSSISTDPRERYGRRISGDTGNGLRSGVVLPQGAQPVEVAVRGRTADDRHADDPQ